MIPYIAGLFCHSWVRNRREDTSTTCHPSSYMVRGAKKGNISDLIWTPLAWQTRMVAAGNISVRGRKLMMEVCVLVLMVTLATSTSGKFVISLPCYINRQIHMYLYLQQCIISTFIVKYRIKDQFMNTFCYHICLVDATMC